MAAADRNGSTVDARPPTRARHRRPVAVLLAVLALLGVAAAPAHAVSAAQGFADVPASHVFHDDVGALATAGITRGCNPPDNTRFCPDDLVTRGQMAAFLDRALQLPTGRASFDDTRDHLFQDGIAALAAAGITRGCNPPDNTRFCPDDLVTRGQMAAFLVRGGLASTPGSPGSPGSFDGPLVGVHMHALWSHYDDDLRARVLDELAAAGVESIRVDIGWASLMEGCRDCISDWYVDLLDRLVTQAAVRDIDVLGVLWRTPSWAGSGDLLAPPHDPADYGRAAGWLAERFQGRITAWELWNEPNLSDYFHGTTSDYVELVEAASRSIRAADPSATIVLGGPAHNDSGWLDEVLGRGVAPLVDVIAVHPYPTPSDDPATLPDPDGDMGRFAHLTTVLEVVDRHAAGTPVWLTEFGWSTHATAAGAPPWKRGVTREQQAQYTVEALELLRDRWPQVERAYLFRALDRDTGSPHLDNFGLLDADADPKPVARQLRRLLVD